jgi:hypothetical protein
LWHDYQEGKIFEKHRKQKGLTSKKRGTKRDFQVKRALVDDFIGKTWSKKQCILLQLT